MTREFFRAVRATLTLWFLTAILYPFAMIAIGQVVFPFQANGSLLTNAQGTPVGSALIGQAFEGDRYFWSRPSTSAYSTNDPNDEATAAVLQTGVSGASNLAPSNPALLERIQGDVDWLRQSGLPPTADLVYTSGSSLDPHISLESAQAQLQRVAAARNVNASQLEPLIAQNTDGRFLGIFGEPGVNVLKLNLALDAL
ncbi:K(+)-transporting ATPase subunit C [Thermoleptolyngbya sp. M55_K2018_002]|uniref:K(+)-transporting ATPase subunit C n=1 Tax=Thermoleptolyngbya sp. M55_K2018_002 TaxID=2747808 RepID=UPI0019E7E92F|nr:K(+)-transporting ATPase subunit C [Thermoleptolyngbya sp. M55_K2018_002]HIK43189.1 K(+)-transporting ATPase subunit C [Thermoleptolyngbya sp. M55_K2018_002]